MTKTTLTEFTLAYIECALWSSTDDQDQPIDKNYGISDIAPEARKQMRDDCEDFEQANAELLARWYEDCGESNERAGHDFWLTRNRDGAGFWDHWNGSTPQGKIGRELTDAAHAYGSCDLYVGDDGLIYCA